MVVAQGELPRQGGHVSENTEPTTCSPGAPRRWRDDRGHVRAPPHRALVRAAPDDLDALMRMRVVRRVAKDRTVRLDGRLYEARDGHAGDAVEVL